MDLAFTDEQQMLHDTVTDYLATAVAADTVSRWLDAGGCDRDIWPELAGLGWLDSDFGLLDEVILLEATAAALLPAPLFSTRLALPVLDETSCRAVADGTLRIALAWAEPGHATAFTELTSIGSSLQDEKVTGRKVLVADADQADAFVVVVASGEGPALALVRASEAEVTARNTSDRSRRLCDVTFHAAAATLLEQQAGVSDALESLQHRSCVFAAAEALGVGRQALQLSLEHARDRRQFGKPIGAYQAVSHRLVDAYIDLELSRSLTYWAAHYVEIGDSQRGAAAAAAKGHAATAAVRACEAAIQVAGGAGMTWEHPLHRLYKRAQWLECYLASEEQMYRTVADTIFTN